MSDFTITSAQYVNSDNDMIKAVIDGDTVYFQNYATGNRHYEALMDWVAEGNTIQDAD